MTDIEKALHERVGNASWKLAEHYEEWRKSPGGNVLVPKEEVEDILRLFGDLSFKLYYGEPTGGVA